MSERDDQYFRRWYEANGEDLNKRRRERYHNDPEYRERMKAKAREYRREGPKQQPRIEYKVIDGVEQRVYRITEIAELVGVHKITLYRLEKAGVIPEPKYDSKIRFYSEAEREALTRFVTRTKESGKALHNPPDEYVQQLFEEWR